MTDHKLSHEACMFCIEFEERPSLSDIGWCHFCDEETHDSDTCDWHDSVFADDATKVRRDASAA